MKAPHRLRTRLTAWAYAFAFAILAYVTSGAAPASQGGGVPLVHVPPPVPAVGHPIAPLPHPIVPIGHGVAPGHPLRVGAPVRATLLPSPSLPSGGTVHGAESSAQSGGTPPSANAATVRQPNAVSGAAIAQAGAPLLPGPILETCTVLGVGTVYVNATRQIVRAVAGSGYEVVGQREAPMDPVACTEELTLPHQHLCVARSGALTHWDAVGPSPLAGTCHPGSP
jgi:hypothetical protein